MTVWAIILKQRTRRRRKSDVLVILKHVRGLGGSNLSNLSCYLHPWMDTRDCSRPIDRGKLPLAMVSGPLCGTIAYHGAPHFRLRGEDFIWKNAATSLEEH